MRKHLLCLTLLVPLMVFAQEWNFTQKIIKEDFAASDIFGTTVILKDNYAFISEATPDRTGAVYFYEKEEEGWVQKQRITASDAAALDFFGNSGFGGNGGSVQVVDDFLIIGAFQEDEDENGENTVENAGSVYVFKKEGELWLEQYKLVAPNRSINSRNFGAAISVEGDYMVIGEPGSEGVTGARWKGAAYVYKLIDGIWTEQTKLILPADEEGCQTCYPNFGGQVLIQGDYIYISASGRGNENTGSLYIFKRENGNWELQQKLLPQNETGSIQFGTSVSVYQDYLVVGAPYENEDENDENTINRAGAAYVFKREGEQWEQMQKLAASTRTTQAQFGYGSVAQGNMLAISAPFTNLGVSQGGNEGAVTIFKLENDLWIENQILSPSVDSYGAAFGEAMSVYDSELMIGAHFENIDFAISVGAVYTFELDCSYLIPEINSIEAICPGENAEITVNAETVNWYETMESDIPLFSGATFTTPDLIETTSYWVEINDGTCTSARTEVVITVDPLPELTIENTEIEVCSGNEASLYAFSEGNVIFWYANEEDTEYIYHGNNFITEPLTENTTYWVEAYNLATGCKSDRIEVTITVNPFADLTVEETEAEICEGNTATFTAVSSSTVNWYDTADSTTPIFTGMEFTTPELFENTLYWVEASGSGECVSERIEITITVSSSPSAPLAYEIQEFEEGDTLADLEVEAEGELTWYSDEELTIEIPETTLLVDDTIYWVTQTLNGCESEATDITVDDDTLGTGNVNETDFTYYPNPVKDKLYFKGTEKVQSVQVYDMSGKLLINQSQSAGIEQLDVTILPKGTYIVKAQTEKEVKTFKIAKQ